MDLKPVWVPIVQRLFPTVGPGGVASGLSFVLHADATKMVHVTRYADIQEVWGRDEDFSVRTYGERMAETTGPFVLGMTDKARYERESRILGQVLRREDVQLVRRIAREESERAIARTVGRGRIDAVSELASVVAIRTVMRYFGIEVADPARLLTLFQTTSWYIFAFWFDPAMRDAALACARDLRPLLDDVVASRRRSRQPGDGDVLGRLLALSSEFEDGDGGVVRSLAGLCSGTLNAPIGLFVNMLDKLLSLDAEERATVHELAQSEASRERLRDYLLEAQRFGVFPGALCRFAERSTTIADGTPRATAIAEGTTVVLWPSLAGFDADVFDQPFHFMPGRPRSAYMTVGHGRHRCLGEHVGQVLVEEMARSLLALRGLRRAPGDAGTVHRLKTAQASFPDRFELVYDAPEAALSDR